MTWPGLPVLVTLADRPVILLGAGEAADAKRRLLERAGAQVVEDHPDARLAIVAIEDDAEAHATTARLKARGILVNAVDRPALCDFTLPAIVDRAPVLVAVMTGGVSAGLAAALRQRLESLMPSQLGRLATALFNSRTRLRNALPDAGERRRALGEALSEGGALDPLTPFTLGTARYEEQVAEWLASGGGQRGHKVAHVTVSSPDPDHLTLFAARALALADRVFHDAAVPPAILSRIRADAVRSIGYSPANDEPLPGLTVQLYYVAPTPDGDDFWQDLE